MSRKREALLSIYIDRQVREKLKRIASEYGRTMAELVREAIAEIIRRYDCVEKEDDRGVYKASD